MQASPHFFVENVGFLCPALEIKRVADHLRITSDPVGFESFLNHVFPAA